MRLLFFSRRRGAITKALQGVTRRYRGVTSRYGAVTSRYTVVTEPLRVVTQSLRSRYQSCEPLRSWAAQKKPVPYSGIRSGPSHPRRVLPLGVFPQRPCHRGTLHGEPPVLMCAAGSEKEKRAGGPLHWGHYSTPVRILQGRVGITWAEGVVLACDAIPPAPPSNVFGYRGTFLYRGRGLRPFTLLGGEGESYYNVHMGINACHSHMCYHIWNERGVRPSPS